MNGLLFLNQTKAGKELDRFDILSFYIPMIKNGYVFIMEKRTE